MTLPKLPSVADIHSRLERLFTPGLEMRKNLVREMAAKTVFVFMYGGMVEGVDRCLRPSHVYFFTEDQAQKSGDEDRLLWLAQSKKPGDAGRRVLGADQRGRPMTPIDLAVWWALQLWFGAWR